MVAICLLMSANAILTDCCDDQTIRFRTNKKTTESSKTYSQVIPFTQIPKTKAIKFNDLLFEVILGKCLKCEDLVVNFSYTTPQISPRDRALELSGKSFS